MWCAAWYVVRCTGFAFAHSRFWQVVCGKVEDLLAVYLAVVNEFNVVEGKGRVKMNFREENNMSNPDRKPPDV